MMLCVLCVASACRTTPRLPPVDISQAGWRLEHGQAAWRLPSGEADVAGELIAAFHPDGSVVLEFTKTPLTLAVVRIHPDAWQLNLPAQHRVYEGEGAPPPRSAWLVLGGALTGKSLAEDWCWTVTGPGEWVLEHAHTRERLQGYLRP